jgi:hypothetical protein
LDTASRDVITDQTMLDQGNKVGHCLLAIDNEERRENDESAQD